MTLEYQEMNSITVDNVSAVLFCIDPMNTSCVENGLSDEYQKEAEIIHAWIKPGINRNMLAKVIETLFNDFWWEGCIKQQKTEEIADELLKLAGVH